MSAEPAIPPQEFAARVLQAFEDAGRFTTLEVALAGGPSTTTLTKFRKVAAGDETMGEPRGDTLAAIDKAAKWEEGSARALWRKGKEPMPLLPGVHPANSAALREAILGSDLEPAVREEILRILDSA